MTIESNQVGDRVVLRVAGRMDAENAPEFEKSCESWISQGITVLVVDVGGLAYVSSMGLRPRSERGRRAVNPIIPRAAAPSRCIHLAFSLALAIKFRGGFETKSATLLVLLLVVRFFGLEGGSCGRPAAPTQWPISVNR